MAKQHRLSRTLMIAAATLALGACAGDPPARSAAQYTDDASINTNVQAAVVSVPGVHANDMQVNTYEGVVSLRGNVDDQLAAQNAVQAARQVAGVKKVDYNIKIKQP
ncbi:MAG: BON domain-containing protein [Burkholderiaceae bacterium]